MKMGRTLRRFQSERWTTLYRPMKADSPLRSYFVGADFASVANSQMFVERMPDWLLAGAGCPG